MSEAREQVLARLKERTSWPASELIYDLAANTSLSPAEIRLILQREFDAGTVKRNDQLQLYWDGP